MLQENDLTTPASIAKHRYPGDSPYLGSPTETTTTAISNNRKITSEHNNGIAYVTFKNKRSRQHYTTRTFMAMKFLVCRLKAAVSEATKISP